MLHNVTLETHDFVEVLLPEAIEHSRIPSDAVTRETATISRYLRAAIQATENYLDKDLYPKTHSYSDVCYPFEWTRGNVRSASVIVPTPAALVAAGAGADAGAYARAMAGLPFRGRVIAPGVATDYKGEPESIAVDGTTSDPDRIKVINGAVIPAPDLGPGTAILADGEAVIVDEELSPPTSPLRLAIHARLHSGLMYAGLREYTPPEGWELYPTAPAMAGGFDLRSARLLIGDSSYAPSGGQLVIEGGFASAADLPDDVVQFILAVFGTHYELRESSNYSSMVFNVDNYPKFLLDPYRTLSYA